MHACMLARMHARMHIRTCGYFVYLFVCFCFFVCSFVCMHARTCMCERTCECVRVRGPCARTWASVSASECACVRVSVSECE